MIAIEALASSAASSDVVVVQAELLDDPLGLADSSLECGLGLLRRDELEQFNLVELVAADRAALLGPVAPALAPVARRVGERLLRQLRERQDLVENTDNIAVSAVGSRKRGRSPVPTSRWKTSS